MRLRLRALPGLAQGGDRGSRSISPGRRRRGQTWTAVTQGEMDAFEQLGFSCHCTEPTEEGLGPFVQPVLQQPGRSTNGC